jgi:hypothetical protein
MAPIGFLDLPLTVRNHIYADLLVPQSVPDTKIFFEPININILFTNRQIYKESSDIFYSQNLFTVIETNDTSLIFNIPEKHVTIFARNLVNIEHCKRIAMTVEMYMFDNRLPAFSRMYLLPHSFLFPPLDPNCHRRLKHTLEMDTPALVPSPRGPMLIYN